MRARFPFLILGALGISLIGGAIFVHAGNSGSCPMIPVGSYAGCDHTFPGSSVYIGATANEMTLGGILALILAWMVGVYGLRANPVES